mmetsp:Transcript_7302/g.12730  ORF Transcript_7302/g.12730 Transcript_7302/m.12730 type:complete len:129 (-) Transcript_7302:967-1353(-)
MEGFGLFGIIKETGVDDEGLMEFYNDYFTYPLYRDVDLKFYEGLGNRKLSLPWNPISLFKGVFEFRKVNNRLKDKNIGGNIKGEGLTKGGIILFDKNGKQKYAYLEETGDEIPLEDILAAMADMKTEE